MQVKRERAREPHPRPEDTFSKRARARACVHGRSPAAVYRCRSCVHVTVVPLSKRINAHHATLICLRFAWPRALWRGRFCLSLVLTLSLSLSVSFSRCHLPGKRCLHRLSRERTNDVRHQGFIINYYEFQICRGMSRSMLFCFSRFKFCGEALKLLQRENKIRALGSSSF